MVLRDTVYAISREWLDVSDDIKELPNLKGFGNVPDLHQAMARDKNGELKQLVRMAMGESVPSTRTAIFEQLLFKWAGVDNVVPTSRGPAIDARRLALVEKIFGHEFIGINPANARNPNDNAAALLNQSFLGTLEMYYAQFMIQTHLKGLYSIFIHQWDKKSGWLLGDPKPVIPKLQEQINEDEEKGKVTLSEFTRTLKGLKARYVSGHEEFLKTFAEYGEDIPCIGPKKRIIGDNNSNILLGSPGPDIIEGKEGNDYISGGLCDDELYGGEGNDKLYGDDGDDTLDGGPGDDYLCGGAGNDIYVWGKGYENDYIYEFDQSKNIIRFTKGVSKSSLLFFWSGKDLNIQIKRTGEGLKIQEWEKNNFYNIEKFVFADGKVLFPAEILKVAKEGEPRLALYELRDPTFYILITLVAALLMCLIIIRIRRKKVK